MGWPPDFHKATQTAGQTTIPLKLTPKGNSERIINLIYLVLYRRERLESQITKTNEHTHKEHANITQKDL